MILAIFRVRTKGTPSDRMNEEYAHMLETLLALDGIREHKAFQSEDGEMLQYLEFEDEVALDRFRDHPEHLRIKKSAVADEFAWWDVRIATVDESYGVKAPRADVGR